MTGAMARPIRIQYPGAVYHVMARGSHGQAIYADDTDRRVFLQTLGEACERTGWRVHAYVLMGNHYHGLIETPEPNLVAGMKWLQGTYTQRYNRRHRVLGHLFQGRYKALPVDSQAGENYFQVVSTYIHLNPARAGLIRIGRQRLKEYAWSSYPAYVQGAVRGPAWLRTGRVLGSLRLGPGQRRGYEAYVEGRVLELGTRAGRRELEAQWEALRRGWFVGGETFRAKLEELLDGVTQGLRRESHSGPAKTAHDEAAAGRWLAGALLALGLTREELEAQSKAATEKQVLAWWLRQHTTVSLRWLAERLAMGHFTRVSQAIGQVGRHPTRAQRRLVRRLDRLARRTDAAPENE